MCFEAMEPLEQDFAQPLQKGDLDDNPKYKEVAQRIICEDGLFESFLRGERVIGRQFAHDGHLQCDAFGGLPLYLT